MIFICIISNSNKNTKYGWKQIIFKSGFFTEVTCAIKGDPSPPFHFCTCFLIIDKIASCTEFLKWDWTHFPSVKIRNYWNTINPRKPLILFTRCMLQGYRCESSIPSSHIVSDMLVTSIIYPTSSPIGTYSRFKYLQVCLFWVEGHFTNRKTTITPGQS